MNTTLKFIIFQVVIILPFAFGTIIRTLIKDPVLFTRRLLRINLILIEPLIVLWSIWGLCLDWDLVVLPFAGLVIVCSGLFLGRVILPGLHLGEKGSASFLISSSLANHGFTMGSFLCYLFMGERGLALSFIFLSYFMPYVFLVVFPYARYVASGRAYTFSLLNDFFLNLQNMPLYAIILGIVFHTVGFERPCVYFPVDILIMVAVALYYFSLGVNFNISDIMSSRSENIALCLIKFVMVPLVTFSALSLLELDGDIEGVIMIQSFMPAAIYSVVASVLFNLDSRLSSNLFVSNTLIFIVVVLPLLYLFRGYVLSP